MSLNVRATRTVKRYAMDHPDERWLLDVLGLIQDDGTIPPDDTNVYVFPPADRGPSAKDPDGPITRPTRDRSAVPEGLANLPEPSEEVTPKRRGPKPQPKVIRPKKPRQVPECGTHQGYSRHMRRIKAGQETAPMDDACLEAGRKYHREYAADRAARLKREAELKRLTEAGVKDEQAIATLAELVR